LPQQVPALVEGLLDGLQAGRLVLTEGLLHVLQAKVALLGDQLVDVLDDLLVVHFRSSRQVWDGLGPSPASSNAMSST
jgi:hypothetical protein